MHHKNCHASYVVPAAFHEAGQKTNYNPMFRELADNITTELQHGKYFDTSALLIRYKAMLQERGVVAEIYTSQRLIKLRLKKHFGVTLYFISCMTGLNQSSSTLVPYPFKMS